jgi:hypothetical protein
LKDSGSLSAYMRHPTSTHLKSLKHRCLRCRVYAMLNPFK